MAKLIKGILGFSLIVAGTALIFWPAALVVAGVLLIVDVLTE